MSLQDLPAITIERLDEGGAWAVRVEVLGVALVTYTTEAALALADKAASFGDNKLAAALRAAVEEARSRMASH
jgi:hypothetical protein